MTHTENLSTVDKGLAWTGLVFGGGLSIAGNLVAGTITGLPDDLTKADIDAWRALPAHDMTATAGVTAVAVPFAAILLVEMLKRWTFLPAGIRRGAIGAVAFIAAAASWVHLATVLLHEGNHPIIAAFVPLIPDIMAIVSAMALLSGERTDKTTPAPWTPDTLDTIDPDTRAHIERMSELLSGPDTDNGADSLPDTLDTDTYVDPDNFVPDTWTPDSVDTLDDPAPVDIVDTVDTVDTDPIPTPRRTVVRTADKGWQVMARAALDLGWSPSMIASMILDNEPNTWPTREAGRKAVARLS